MLDVKQAVMVARRYAEELYTPQLHDLRLEEVEILDDPPAVWRVTLSFYEDPDAAFAQRQYKQFTIDAQSGRVTAMRIRQVA